MRAIIDPSRFERALVRFTLRTFRSLNQMSVLSRDIVYNCVRVFALRAYTRTLHGSLARTRVSRYYRASVVGATHFRIYLLDRGSVSLRVKGAARRGGGRRDEGAGREVECAPTTRSRAFTYDLPCVYVNACTRITYMHDEYDPVYMEPI